MTLILWSAFAITVLPNTFPIAAPLKSFVNRISGQGIFHLQSFTSGATFPFPAPNLLMPTARLGNDGLFPSVAYA